MTDQNNENTIREEWGKVYSTMPHIPYQYHVDETLIADWWLKKLHQAELNWLTAQIERVQKVYNNISYNDREQEENADPVVQEYKGLILTPLIERKKELEKLLEVTQ